MLCEPEDRIKRKDSRRYGITNKEQLQKHIMALAAALPVAEAVIPAAARLLPAAATALAGAGEIGKYVWDNRHGIAKGAQVGIRLAKKYHSNVIKPIANTLFTVSGRRKAASAIKARLDNPKKALMEASNYIASGKALRVAKDVAGDAHSAISAAEQISGRDLGKHRSMVNQGTKTFTHYHDLVHKYNSEARELM